MYMYKTEAPVQSITWLTSWSVPHLTSWSGCWRSYCPLATLIIKSRDWGVVNSNSVGGKALDLQSIIKLDAGMIFIPNGGLEGTASEGHVRPALATHTSAVKFKYKLVLEPPYTCACLDYRLASHAERHTMFLFPKEQEWQWCTAQRALVPPRVKLQLIPRSDVCNAMAKSILMVSCIGVGLYSTTIAEKCFHILGVLRSYAWGRQHSLQQALGDDILHTTNAPSVLMLMQAWQQQSTQQMYRNEEGIRCALPASNIPLNYCHFQLGLHNLWDNFI